MVLKQEVIEIDISQRVNQAKFLSVKPNLALAHLLRVSFLPFIPEFSGFFAKYCGRCNFLGTL